MSENSPKAGAFSAWLEIDMRIGGAGQEYLIAGWSYPETDYTWTLGKVSIIRFPSPGLVMDCGLKFRTAPMMRPGKIAFQRVNVEVNGTQIARLVSRMPAQYELYVPAEAVGGREFVEIVFQLPDACSPAELGGSGDTRELGVWVSSLQFGPLLAAAPAPGNIAADKAMLMDLQSLGENCELGFVQRFNGAEPLGLFRWASTPLPILLAALEARFEGLGLPENLSIELDDASEFQVIDRRYGFRNHSFAFANAGAKREDILKREAVRLPFLARLLTEELEKATKLFCFHDAGGSGQDRIERLVAALNRYGPNTLLWICQADGPSRAGTAERLGPALIRGYIDHFQPIHNVQKPSLDPWLAAIREAHALWRSG
jgi:hypothetical protein